VSRERSLKRLLASQRDAWLAARALGWLCALPVLKRTLALERLVRLMWLAPGGNARDSGRERRTIRIVARLARTSGGNCLERSLVLYRYLALARPDEYLGHVWVTVDGQPLLETPETLGGYTEVVTFRAGRAQHS